MPIDYKLSRLVINTFRGIDHLELEFRNGFPSVLIGSNNAGKSTVLNAIALALGGGGSHQWTFSETDFFATKTASALRNFSSKYTFIPTPRMVTPPQRRWKTHFNSRGADKR